jgi:hypothetical protein
MTFSFRQPRLLLTTLLCAGFFLPALIWGQSSAEPSSSSVESSGAAALASTPGSSETVEVPIPGPVRSFLRMAGVSQKVSREEVLPLVARNVFMEGYQAGRPTEFLILLNRYVQQARELTDLAGASGVIRVSDCGEAKPLLDILGYRLRQDCGQPTTALMTADAEKAFITIDSGFPLPDLEEALQSSKPFVYPYQPSRVPALSSESDWILGNKEKSRYTKDLVDALLRDPDVARLYWALSRCEPETRRLLLQSPGIRKLVVYHSVLDFYGSHVSVRAGHVVVPGGVKAEAAWKDLVGVSPDSPSEFTLRLMAKDKGWLAAYFDALSRVSETQQSHFLEPVRLRRYYEAFRGSDIAEGAARPSFRPAPGLLLLLTRMRWEASGEPYVPGDLAVWKEVLGRKSDSKIVRDWGKRARGWTRPEQLAEGMFALSRVESETGPLQAYLLLSQLDSERPPNRRLSPETVRTLANKFTQFSDQYLIFSEFPSLDDASILAFLNVAESLDHIPNHTLRGNAMGTFQAEVGIWQILARQGQIPAAEQNESWQQIVKPFARIGSPVQLYDSAHVSLEHLLHAATGKESVSEGGLIALLAGPQQSTAEGQQMHQEMAGRIRSVLDGQRLVSLDTILALGQGLKEMEQGGTAPDYLAPLAGELREFEMPRPIFTGSERTQWAAGTYNNHHTDLEMRTDVGKLIKTAHSKVQLEEARGELTPFLRDSLVGLNYAYYEPPGAQVLHNNPLLVRSHDFSGDTVAGIEHLWQASQVFGEGSPAGGGAHLVGSLADLPYVLASMEQDFIAPENVQALIWRELVPGLMISATLPRWWAVSGTELHAVALHQQAGEELLTAAAGNEQLRRQVLNILSDRMVPQRSERVEQALRAGKTAELFPRLMPSDAFYLSAEFINRHPDESDLLGPAGQELLGLRRQYPTEVSWQRLSRDFGVPHPILAQSYGRELLNLKPFPAFEGYSSRLLAETWDSNNLYWARLADEKGYPPVVLNRLVPELTRRMVEKIFATEFEDWPALLRAMHEAGEDFRQGKIASLQLGEASRP